MKQFHILILTVTCVVLNLSLSMASTSTAGLWLQNQLQGHALVCTSSKIETFYLKANDGEILVHSGGVNRGENYIVDHAIINSSQIKVSMSNDIDGPLATDLFVASLNDIVILCANKVSSIFAWDIYSEQYDGTTQKIKLSCRIEK